MEEEHESGVQEKIIERGELYAQEIKKSDKTGKIDTAISSAYEKLDQLSVKGQSQQNLKRFVKSNLEAIGGLRKEVLLQSMLINSFEESKSRLSNS